MRIRIPGGLRPCRTPAVVAAAGVLVLGGCSPAEEASQFPVISARDLEPSDMKVVGYPDGQVTPEDWDGAMPWGQVVADGVGQVWMTSSWGVTRLDPRSGDSTTWDAADDAAFGSIDALAPTAGTGVWLLGGDRVRLFDGQRFRVDLQVPEEILASGGGRGTVGHVHDLAEAGSDLWLSVHDVVFPGAVPGRGIARWTAGTWSQMATTADGVAGYLEADVEGLVWAGGWLRSEGELDGSGVRQWDGSGWSLPASGSDQGQGMRGDVVADPSGGVWLLSTANEEGPPSLLRFDGSSWSPMDAEAVSSALGAEGWGLFPGLSVEPAGEWGPGTVTEGAAIGESRAAWLAVTASGDAWLAGQGGLAQFTADGSPRVFGVDQFAAPIRGVAAARDEVVVADLEGVLRLDGDGFTRVWRDPELDDVWAETMAAVSADEVWLTSSEGQEGAPSLYRNRGDTWDVVGPADAAASCYYSGNTPEDGSGPAAVVATDGAVWSGTIEGLTRFEADGSTVVGAVQGCAEFPGPDDGVWTRSGNRFALHLADGTTQTVPPPGSQVCRWAAGPDGTVVVSSAINDDPEDDYECAYSPSALLRWDGDSWAPIDAPGPAVPVVALLVTDDGAVWVAARGSGGGSLLRYADGQWTVPSPDAGDLLAVRAATDGRVCTLDSDPTDFLAGKSIRCFDGIGEIAGFDVSGMGVSDFSVAPDGAIWVTGPKVARLAETLPNGRP